MTTRQASFAGMFYPLSARALTACIDSAIEAVEVPEDDRLAEAYIVPHAGYRFSGHVAAEVYARLRRHHLNVKRVVIIGPSHRIALTGCAISDSERWSTPLGEIALDKALIKRIITWAQEKGICVVADDGAHDVEHSLEVQVPFLQRVLDTFIPIIPICVGRATPQLVADVIDVAGGGSSGTVVLCSTDLSHYLTDRQARNRDATTASAIVSFSHESIGDSDACGAYAVRGLLDWARRSPQSHAVTLKLANSADTGGDPEKVVGYSAFALFRPGSLTSSAATTTVPTAAQ